MQEMAELGKGRRRWLLPFPCCATLAGMRIDARLMAAVRDLVELLPWEPARRAALCAISRRTGALNRLLDLVRVRSWIHPPCVDRSSSVFVLRLCHS